MRARRSSFFVASAVVALVSAIAATSPAAPAAPAAAAAAPAPAAAPAAVQAASSESGESSVLPAPGDHTLTRCSNKKLTLCGIGGDNVCCDNETECCVRKHHRTICARKKDKC